MITDEWNGLGVYETQDYTHWERQGYILRDGGSRNCDGVMASHADVVSKGDIAYIFYFTHPYFTNEHLCRGQIPYVCKLDYRCAY